MLSSADIAAAGNAPALTSVLRALGSPDWSPYEVLMPRLEIDLPADGTAQARFVWELAAAARVTGL